jgi:hypothetical protein
MEEAGGIPRWQANTFDVFGHNSAELSVFCLEIWKKND